jgi:hypothetical protein
MPKVEAFHIIRVSGPDNDTVEYSSVEDNTVRYWKEETKFTRDNPPLSLITARGYEWRKSGVLKTYDNLETDDFNTAISNANKYFRTELVKLKAKNPQTPKYNQSNQARKEKAKVRRMNAAAAAAAAIPPTPLSTAVAATPATTTTKAVAVIAATPFATATVDAASAPASINNHDIIQALLPVLHNQQQLIANTIHNQEQHAADQLQQAANQQEMMSHFHNQQLLNSTTIKDNTLAIEETKEDLADHKLDTSREMKQMREEFIDSLKKKPAESSANHDNNPRKLLGSFDAAPEDAYGHPAADDDDAVAVAVAVAATVDTPRARGGGGGGGGGGSTTVDKEVTEENRNFDPLGELVPHNACSSPDAAALAAAAAAGGDSTTVDKEVTEENRNSDPLKELVPHNACSSPDAAALAGGGAGGFTTTVDKEVTEEKTGNDDPLEKLVPHNACSSPDAAIRGGGGGGGSTTVDKEGTEEKTGNDDAVTGVPRTDGPPVAATLTGGGGGSTTIDKEGPEENRNYDTGTGGTPTYGPPVAAADDAGTGDTPRSEGIKATPAPAPTTKPQENSMSSDDDEDAEYLAYVASYVGEEIQQKGEENEYERTNEDINNNIAQTRVEEVGDGTGSKSIVVSVGNNSRGGGGSTTVDKEGTEEITGNGNDNAGNNFIVTNKRRVSVSLGGNDDDNNNNGNDSSSNAAPAGVPTLSSIGGPPRKKLQGEDGSTIHYFSEEKTETCNDNDNDNDDDDDDDDDAAANDDIFLEDCGQEESPVADAHAGIQDLPIESQKQKARWLSLGSIGWFFTLGIAIIFIIVGGGCCRFLEPNDIRNSINGFISIILNGIMNIKKIGINNSNHVFSSKFYLYLHNNLFGTNENTPSFEEAEETQCFLDSDFDLGSEDFLWP